MSKGTEIIVFDAKVCKEVVFKTIQSAEQYYNVRGFYRAWKLKRMIYNRYFITDVKLSKKEKLELYKRYCNEYIDTNIEKWKQTKIKGVEVSSLGRLKRNGELKMPHLRKNTLLCNLRVDEKAFSIAISKLVVEAFILKRELKKNEAVDYLISNTNVEASSLRVTTRSQKVKKYMNGIEVAMLNEEGEVLGIYNSLANAAKENLIAIESISRCINYIQKTANGMIFRKLEEVEGW